jgi:hypothetical protein
MENNIQPMHWTAPSHTHKAKSTDWMWGVGLAAFVGAGIAIYLQNYVFGVFILMGGAVMIMMYASPAVEIPFEINSDGIKVGTTMHEYKSLNGFTVKNTPKEILMIETKSYFLPVITIPLPEHSANSIRVTLSKVLTELNLQESRSMQFAEKIGL